MQTKKADVLYCGVNAANIHYASPKLNEEVLRHHHLYLTERHEIYKRKEILKLPQDQWTDDEVFKNYRFTNIRRELDRESKYLIQKVSLNDDLTLEEKILNSILFRTFNKSETLELIDFPIMGWSDMDLDEYRKIFVKKAEEDPKYVFFTPAFMTGGLKKGNAFKVPPYVRKEATIVFPDGHEETWEYIKARDYVNPRPDHDIKEWERNIPTRMLRFVQREFKEGIVQDILNATSQKEVYERLVKVTGFGHFLAYQVFVDLTYIPEFPFSENEFTVSGPGCTQGLNMLFEDRDGLTDEELLFWVRDNIQEEWEKRGLKADYNELFDHLPEHDRNLNLMMCENSFCELSKIVKAKRGTGRPRNKYKPTEPENITATESNLLDWE